MSVSEFWSLQHYRKTINSSKLQAAMQEKQEIMFNEEAKACYRQEKLIKEVAKTGFNRAHVEELLE